MKRFAASLLVAAAVLASPSRAAADEQIPEGSPWGGSMVNTPEPITGPTTNLYVNGRIQNSTGQPQSVAYPRPTVAVTFDPNGDTGCDLGPGGPATEADMGAPTFDNRVPARWKQYTYSANLSFAPDRNGVYPLFVCINGTHRLDTDVLVRLPAPTVTNVVATSAGREVTLSWDDMRGAAPDLAGYRIERSVGGSPFSALQTTAADATTFTDTTLPAEGGEATYQVIGLRPFVTDAAPSDPSLATFSAASADPGGDGAGDGTVSGGGGTAGATGGGGAGGTGGGTTGGNGPGGGGGVAVTGGPVIRVPRVGTPSRNFFPPLLAPPAIDTGFSEALPFEEPANEEAAVLPDELGLDDERLPGRGLVIPIATGLVLLVWALHLRFLAKASRPEYDDPIEVFLN